MDEVNYNDKVIIPFLEKKCKDLLSHNLVLEAKLLVEQNKLKDFQESSGDYSKIEKLEKSAEEKEKQIKFYHSEFTACNEDKIKIIADKLELQSKIATLQSELTREISVKNSAIGEYNILKSQYDELNKENEALKLQINTKKSK
jgi:hypothetical protein